MLLMLGNKEGGCLFQGPFFFRAVKDECVFISVTGLCAYFTNLVDTVEVSFLSPW